VFDAGINEMTTHVRSYIYGIDAGTKQMDDLIRKVYSLTTNQVFLSTRQA